mmetsp:Transcript_127302/g.249458  ORF Transcript_127302/g.249458 Transcript_127302/m.249458 type:complete len:238 (+) Transcript_127302:139-852(+)
MLYPLTMFCCGCSVPFGVGLIMLLHLLANIAYVVCASMNLIAHHPVFTSTWSVHSQLLLVMFCLGGLPVIAGGLWGLVQRVEINLRLYLLYLTLSVVVVSAALVRFFLAGDVCANDGTFFESLESSLGEAFLCGTFRTLSYLWVSVAITLQAYCVWAVWSLCEDVRDGGGGPELSDLIPSKDAIIAKSKYYFEGPQGGIVGFSRSSLPGPYGSISVEGESTIFGGSAHEMDYPPRGF